jgi:elongation factor Ts
MEKDFLEKIKELREKTQASIAECKEALQSCQGDLGKAEEYLRQKGYEKIQKRESKEAREGVIQAYIHFDKKTGVLVELNCETDFVAKNPDFEKLAYEIALQIAATEPKYIGNEKETENLSEEERESSCLLEQVYIKNPSLKIKDLIAEAVTRFGEKIEIGRFVRFDIKKGPLC